MTQAITVKEVKANAAKAYDDGLLLAQGGSQTPYGYSQVCKDGVTRFCAIGASLNGITQAAIKHNLLDSVGLNSLVRNDLKRYISWKRRQGKKLTAIQFSHDSWMKMVKRSSPEQELSLVRVAEAEALFLKTIGHKKS